MTASVQLTEPFVANIPAYQHTLGPEVAELCEIAGFAPDPEQRLCLDAMFALGPDGRRPAAFEFAVICPRQNMKALDVSTPLLTSTGWSTMGDVEPGAEVFHPAGHLVKVIGVSDVKLGHSCYRVTSTDGRSVVADAGHLWTVLDRRSGKSGAERVMTTAEMAAEGLHRPAGNSTRTTATDGKRYTTAEYRFGLPVQQPLKSPDVELPIDPYLFGAWLGDGTSNGGRLASHADDVAHWESEIRRCGFKPTVSVERTCSVVGITYPGVGKKTKSFNACLRALGVLGDKQVPDLYLTAGTSQREALLQGLLDTDGTIHHRSGQVTFTSSRQNLADAVVYLARSLGWRATLKAGRALLNGRDCGAKYVVCFTPKRNDPFSPFRIERKAVRVGATDGGKGRFTVSIKSIEPVASVPVRCIKVDSPDGLFLAGRDLMATHNTGLMKMAALGWLFVTDQELIVWSAHEMDTTREAFRDLVNLIEDTPILADRLAPGPTRGIHRGNGVEAIELAPSAACPSGQRIRFRARTNAGGRGLSGDKVILDEAFALKPEHMGSLMPTLSTRPEAQIVYGSSACRANSDVLRGIVERGQSADAKRRERLAYLEWAAPEGICEDSDCPHHVGYPGCAMDDPHWIGQANPQAGRRISWEYLHGERQGLDAAEFGRERMGWHDKPMVEEGPLISREMWAGLADPDSAPSGRVSFGVYVNRLQTHGAIGVAGMRADGKIHVGIVPAARGGQIDSLPGVTWIAPRMKQLADDWKPLCWVIDDRSAAGTLVPDINALGVQVENVTAPDVARACMSLHAKIVEGAIAHRNAKPLADSVTAGKMRDLADGWAWDRKDARADIVQLMAITLAVHGLATAPPPTDVWSFYS